MTDHDVCEKQRANGNSELYLQLRCLSHLPLDW